MERWEGALSPFSSLPLSHSQIKVLAWVYCASALQEKKFPLFFFFSSFVLHLLAFFFPEGINTYCRISDFHIQYSAPREGSRALSPTFTLLVCTFTLVHLCIYEKYTVCRHICVVAIFPCSPANSCQVEKVGQCLHQLGQKEFVLCYMLPRARL